MNIARKYLQIVKISIFFAHLSFTLLLFCSCANNRLIKELEQFMGQEINLSSDLSALWEEKEITLSDFAEAPLKLVVWYDSLGCTSCDVSRMYQWSEMISYADSLAESFRIVYLFTPKKDNLYSLNITLQADKLDYPIFIDQHATFVKQNPSLSKNRQLHSFLLDKNNRVVLVGNPLHNPSLWSLYKRTIQKMIDNDGVLPEQ